MGRLKITLGGMMVMCLFIIQPAFSVEKQGQTGNGQPDLQTVKGQVLKHEQDTLTIKDSAGKTVHLHIGQDTVIPGLPGATFKAGDKVEAQVTPDGHAKVIRPAP